MNVDVSHKATDSSKAIDHLHHIEGLFITNFSKAGRYKVGYICMMITSQFLEIILFMFCECEHAATHNASWIQPDNDFVFES